MLVKNKRNDIIYVKYKAQSLALGEDQCWAHRLRSRHQMAVPLGGSDLPHGEGPGAAVQARPFQRTLPPLPLENGVTSGRSCPLGLDFYFPEKKW